MGENRNSVVSILCPLRGCTNPKIYIERQFQSHCPTLSSQQVKYWNGIRLFKALSRIFQYLQRHQFYSSFGQCVLLFEDPCYEKVFFPVPNWEFTWLQLATVTSWYVLFEQSDVFVDCCNSEALRSLPLEVHLPTSSPKSPLLKARVTIMLLAPQDIELHHVRVTVAKAAIKLCPSKWFFIIFK